MKRKRVLPTLAAVLLLLGAGLPVAGQAPATARAAETAAALAEVDGVPITAEEVDKALGAQLQKLQEQIYTLKRQKVEALIAERLLAKEAARRGVSVPALLDAEVTSMVGLVTEQEVETVYQANKAQFPDEAAAREQIRARLQSQKLATRREALVRALREQAQVVVSLPAPTVVRVEVAVDGAPAKGAATAPVTIVKFEDFHCPFCKRIQPALAQLASRYGDRLRLVHRDFPIDSLHPQARKAHEAARCAAEQGKFWPYHDLLYARAPKASPEELKAYAREAGLDLAAFEQCVGSARYRTAVQKDVEEGSRLGVTATPSFFVNGRLLVGAQPLERFVEVIEEELARSR